MPLTILPKETRPSRFLRPLFRKISALSLVLPALTLGAQGCLNDTYRIPDADAARLASLPPEARAGAIRTIQRTSASTDLTSTPELPPGAPPPPGYAAPGTYDYPPGYYDPSPRVYVGIGLWQPMPSPYYATRGPVGPAVAPTIRSGGAGAMRTTGTNGVGGGKVDKDSLAVLAIAGVAFTVGMIATEGMRYDGWTRVHPAQPVHLIYQDGNQRAVPLYLLSPADLQGVSEAVISENDGRIDRLARAPLDRKGFAWRFEGGAVGGILPDRSTSLGWGFGMSAGYFPTQTFGFLLNLTLAGGTKGATDYINVRYGLEANFMPIALGRLHLGLFGSVAGQSGAVSSDTTPRTNFAGWIVGGGAQAELDLTTRLALTLRGGVYQEVRGTGSSAPPVMMLTAGFTVY